jgi:hypothetical protein
MTMSLSNGILLTSLNDDVMSGMQGTDDNPVARHLGYFAISYANLGHQNNLCDEQPGYQVTYVCAPQVTR